MSEKGTLGFPMEGHSGRDTVLRCPAQHRAAHPMLSVCPKLAREFMEPITMGLPAPTAALPMPGTSWPRGRSTAALQCVHNGPVAVGTTSLTVLTFLVMQNPHLLPHHIARCGYFHVSLCEFSSKDSGCSAAACASGAIQSSASCTTASITP